MNAPRNTARFHVVGQGDVVGPDVELPLVDAQHAAQHRSRMDADSHIQVHLNPITGFSFPIQLVPLLADSLTLWRTWKLAGSFSSCVYANHGSNSNARVRI